MPRIPSLPSLLARKIYKTGQTRGADDDVIYQNRVARNSTVLIPYYQYSHWAKASGNRGTYNNGYIVIIKPEEYFGNGKIASELKSKKLTIGKNCLIFYETREQWNKYNPDERKLKFASSRTSPLKGAYVARVPSTTSEGDQKILRGFTSSGSKGAGIRVYEYASKETQVSHLINHNIDAGFRPLYPQNQLSGFQNGAPILLSKLSSSTHRQSHSG